MMFRGRTSALPSITVNQRGYKDKPVVTTGNVAWGVRAISPFFRQSPRRIVFLVLFLWVVLPIRFVIDLIRVFHQDYRHHKTFRNAFTSTYKRFTTPLMNESQAKKIGLDIVPHACQSTIHRFGHVADGGWDICLDAFLEDTGEQQQPTTTSTSIQPMCRVYSVGINDDTSFDTDIVKKYDHCEIFAFDPTIGLETGYEGFGPRIHFFSIWFAGSDRNTTKKKESPKMTLTSIMNMLGHAKLNILKMDVEGSEWAVFRNWQKEWMSPENEGCPPFRVLAAELHFADPETNSEKNQEQTNLLRKLRDYGFEPYRRVENWRYCQWQGYTGADVMSWGCLEVGWVLTNKEILKRCF